MKTIYCIKDKNESVIYVGQTKNLKRRMYEHRYRKRLDDSYTFHELEKCEENIATEKERYYIDKFSTIEFGLNIVDGVGSRGVNCNEKTRFKEGNDIWKKRKFKKVLHIETNTVYNSARDCAEALGFTAKSINNVCGGYSKSYKKNHFQYID